MTAALRQTEGKMDIRKDRIMLTEKLSNAFGPPGFEDDVLTVLREHLSGLGEIREDKVRNLYIYRKENTGKRPVLMLDAHTDEVGMMVQAVRPNGTLRFLPLGGWNKASLPGTGVTVRAADGRAVRGVIASKPVHFMNADERKKTDFEITDLSIDVGTSSAAETEALGIGVGAPCAPAVRFEPDADRGLMFGKAFDCRIGCAALVLTLTELEGKELPFDVVGVFSSQEEVGERGVRVAVETVRPDIAVCFEGCPADDTFTEPWLSQTRLGSGPMLRHMDKSMIANPRFMRFAVKTAEAAVIPVQCAVREGGGNNGAVINLSGRGIPVIVAGVPVRYIHSANCIAAYNDLENTVRLVTELAEKLSEAVLQSF